MQMRIRREFSYVCDLMKMTFDPCIFRQFFLKSPRNEFLGEQLLKSFDKECHLLTRLKSCFICLLQNFNRALRRNEWMDFSAILCQSYETFSAKFVKFSLNL